MPQAKGRVCAAAASVLLALAAVAVVQAADMPQGEPADMASRGVCLQAVAGEGQLPHTLGARVKYQIPVPYSCVFLLRPVRETRAT